MNAAIEWSRWDEGGPTSLPPDLTPWLPFGEPHCGAANSRGLICTRLPGHTGRHALTTREAYSLVTHDEPVTDAEVDDCLFRMLEPHEIAAGMAFPHDYIWQGTKRSRVRMAGNAVTPPAARDLVAAVVDSLETAA